MARRTLIGIGVLGMFLAFGCAGLGGPGEDNGALGDGFTNYAAPRAQYTMDSELCWQGIGQGQGATPHEAYAACMAAKGWSAQPGVPLETSSD